ncbi:putative reverse transcriptase domain-containing protein [Tanacetum coccineum]|uniref:Reverse transcriptase domain-containing protein n=1 Tax=Tanacetum coccineum TaxID=301880 RepID=A0ABQ5INS4_9ASTR
MNEVHTTKYSVHPGADKMNYDLRDLYWWLGIKKNISMYVIVDRLTKSAHFLAIREDYKMESFARLYINKIVARHGCLYQSYLIMTTDGQSERIMKTLEDMHTACTIDFEGNWDTHLPLVEFPYNNNYHPSVKCAPFEALHERRCRLGTAWYVSIIEASFYQDM